ncbi:MAG: sigma-70 family RNA polymerase sigma factor [Deltaproteobacteria bacterium]|nr:sigma-70 family RNA polymerase sigma factor [Deltaproteobacteria bacterium]
MLARRKDHRAEFEREALVHLDALYGAAYRLARNPRDAEDLVQDALLRAYRFWETFEKDSNCKAWLLRILTNTFINEYQRRKRSREVLDAAQAEQNTTDGVLHHAAAETQKSPEGLLLERSVSDDVQRALDALPDDFRTAVVLCDVEGLSYKEIADIMECPVGTVMSRLFRGRRLLGAALKDFAVAAGYVRPEREADPAAPSGERPIDLASYRATRKGSREGA